MPEDKAFFTSNNSCDRTTWSITLTAAQAQALAENANHTVTVNVSNQAGQSAEEATRTITHDITAPAAPTVDRQATNDTTPTITGTANVGSGGTLTVEVNGATYTVTPPMPQVTGAWILIQPHQLAAH
jgi:hypothetical protein